MTRGFALVLAFLAACSASPQSILSDYGTAFRSPCHASLPLNVAGGFGNSGPKFPFDSLINELAAAGFRSTQTPPRASDILLSATTPQCTCVCKTPQLFNAQRSVLSSPYLGAHGVIGNGLAGSAVSGVNGGYGGSSAFLGGALGAPYSRLSSGLYHRALGSLSGIGHCGPF